MGHHSGEFGTEFQLLLNSPNSKTAETNFRFALKVRYGAFMTVEAKHRLQAVNPSDFACDIGIERFFLSRNSQPDL